jgi:hypothetical protein
VELTLNRKDSLWEMGSGSNWLEYHLANILALHRDFSRSGYLARSDTSGVRPAKPGVLPNKLSVRPAQIDVDPQLADDDAQRVRAIFQL